MRPHGDEQDAFTGWRKVLIWRPGQRKAIKARINRRDRRESRRNINDYDKDE